MSVRSGFEATVYIQLAEDKVKFEYERESYELWLPVHRGHKCVKCGHGKVVKRALYTPDFFLENGIVIETKGRFTALDRRKAMAMREQHPDVDYRLVFMQDNKLSRSSKTRYVEWATKQGIPAAVFKVPPKWYK